MSLASLSRRRGGAVVLDAGMGTALGHLGFTSQESWTAGFEVGDAKYADAVRMVHLQFLRAGADVVTANTFNISQTRVMNVSRLCGITTTREEASAAEARLIHANVAVAKSAIKMFTVEQGRAFDGVLAAALGCYGTAIVGRGSTANRVHSNEAAAVRLPGYGLGDRAQAVLEEFHRSRAVTALEAGVDVLAFETVPDLQEARAIANVLNDLRQTIPSLQAMVMFTCSNATQVDNGDTFEECCAALSACASCVALGVNCTEPRFVDELLMQARRAAPSKLLIAKPNSGESYHSGKVAAGMRVSTGGKGPEEVQKGHQTRLAGLGKADAMAQHWAPALTGWELLNDGTRLATTEEFGSLAWHWHTKCGASLIGGCCRIRHDHISAIQHRISQCLETTS